MMRVITLALAIVFLIGCGDGGGFYKSKDPESGMDSVVVVATQDEVPACEQESQIVFVSETRVFQVCHAGEWHSQASEKGEKGDKGEGEKGDTGIAGATGSQGATGAAGSQGETGAAGAQGIQGIAGATGAQGIQGAAGSQGETGATGAQGIQGETGVQGAGGVYVYDYDNNNLGLFVYQTGGAGAAITVLLSNDTLITLDKGTGDIFYGSRCHYASADCSGSCVSTFNTSGGYGFITDVSGISRIADGTYVKSTGASLGAFAYESWDQWGMDNATHAECTVASGNTDARYTFAYTATTMPITLPVSMPMRVKN